MEQMNSFGHDHTGRTSESGSVALRVDLGLYTTAKASPRGNRIQSVMTWSCSAVSCWCPVIWAVVSPAGKRETVHSVSSQQDIGTHLSFSELEVT